LQGAFHAPGLSKKFVKVGDNAGQCREVLPGILIIYEEKRNDAKIARAKLSDIERGYSRRQA
jgi:hypothetical protein